MSKRVFSLFPSLSGQLFCARQGIPSIFNRVSLLSSLSDNPVYFHSKSKPQSIQNSARELLRKSNFSVGCESKRKSIRMSSTLIQNTINLSPKKLKFTNGKENQQDDSKLYFVKDLPNAQTPTKGSKLAAGYDLKSACEAIVPARGSALVKTGIKIKVPRGTYGRIAPRSGLAWKNKIDVGAGVIDEDYRGPVGVILFNHSDVDFKVEIGDRIAQLICEKIAYPEIEEVDYLDDSERGANGFGSTGTKS